MERGDVPSVKPAETIMLLIEDRKIRCVKDVLVQTSNYFEAMFRAGNFQESQQNEILLKECDYNTMKLLVDHVHDHRVVLHDDVLTSVLKLANMYRFEEIERRLLDRTLSMLNQTNCLKLWAELSDINDCFQVSLMAKAMALAEFESVIRSEAFLNLSIKKVVLYLGSTNLPVSDEHVVCDALKFWLDANAPLINKVSAEAPSNWDSYIFKLLGAVNFAEVESYKVEQILKYRDVSLADRSVRYLRSLVSLTRSDNPNNPFTRTKSRDIDLGICVLAHKVVSNQCIDLRCAKRRKYDDSIEQTLRDVTALYYDRNTRAFRKLGEIDVGDLEGFRMVAYKWNLAVVGGTMKKYCQGGFSRRRYLYDTYKNFLNESINMNHDRTLFKVCVCENMLYLVGGHKLFRKTRNDIIGYNFKTDTWTNALSLTDNVQLSGFQVCYAYNGLLLISLHALKGYLFNKDTQERTDLTIVTTEDFSNIIPKYVVYFYKNYLWVKGNFLIKISRKGTELHVVEYTSISQLMCDRVEAVLCGRYLYSMYTNFQGPTMSLDEYNLETRNSRIILERVTTSDIIEMSNGERFVYRVSNNSLFPFFHYRSLENDSYVNPFIMSCLTNN